MIFDGRWRLIRRMKIMKCVMAAVSLTAAMPSQAGPVEDRAAILQMIAQMERSWNRGDFKGYMAGFKNPDVVFVSGGKFQDGWQGTLDHYVRDYGASPATRGTLHFYDMKVDMLSNDAAMLVGRYHLDRAGRSTEGVNTRLFRKVDGRWRITLNHVSAYDLPATPAATPLAPRSAPAGR